MPRTQRTPFVYLLVTITSLVGCGSDPSTSPNGGNKTGEDPPLTAAPSPAPRTIAAGQSHGCVVVDGAVKCFGSGNTYGALGASGFGEAGYQRAVVSGIADAVEVAVGDRHSCARHADGTVSCWGGNLAGALGAPASTPCGISGKDLCRATPEKVIGIANAVRLIAQRTRTCTLLADGAAWCWGGTFKDSSAGSETAKPFPFAERLVDVGFGGVGLCGVTTSSTIRCFSEDATERPAPLRETVGGPEITGATALAWDKTMLVLRGEALWKSGVEVPFGAVAQVASSANGDVACARLASDAVRCWGDEALGRLGNGVTTGSSFEPVPIAAAPEITGLVATDLAVGGEWSCAKTATGLTCWGVRAPFSGDDVSGPLNAGLPFEIEL